MNRDVAGASNTDRFSVVSGTLPTGLTLSQSGLLSGTLSSVSNYNFTVRAGCKYPSQYADYVFSMDVVPPVSWVTNAGAVLVSGAQYAEKGIAVTGLSFNATNAASYEIVSGSLNTGLSMSPSGAVTGTPTADGSASVTVRAYSTNPAIYKDRAFTLQVGTTPVWSTVAALTDVAKNGALRQQLTATNAATYAVYSSTLPTGASLSAAGLLEGENLYDFENTQVVHHLNQALRANVIYRRDTDYIVRGGKVVIIDEFTGRMMDGRRWSDGLHQAVEAKEGVQIQPENQTLASVTFQNYFRMYPKLGGMTGTAATEASPAPRRAPA